MYYIVYYFFMEFEWDENKNEINKIKHGISFETAALAFEDENRVELFDKFHSTLEEERFILIGKVKGILTVIFTERKEKVRIISARIANSIEKEIYYGNR